MSRIEDGRGSGRAAVQRSAGTKGGISGSGKQKVIGGAGGCTAPRSDPPYSAPLCRRSDYKGAVYWVILRILFIFHQTWIRTFGNNRPLQSVRLGLAAAALGTR